MLLYRDALLRDERGTGMLPNEPDLQQKHQHLHRVQRRVLRSDWLAVAFAS